MAAPKDNLTASERLIFALDVSSAEDAKALVSELEGTINFFKVGLQLFMSTGLDVVKWLVDKDLNVFLDMKMDDTTETIRSSVREVARLGVKFLTIHGNGATAQAAIEGRGDSSLKILSLTLLTSLDEQDLRDLFIIGHRSGCKTLEQYIQWRSEQAMKHGCDGLITSGQNAAFLRQQLTQYDPILVCPGIRPKGYSSNDHKRTATPYEAVLNGADYLVVGRPIRNASDRVAKAVEIIDDIDRALQGSGIPA